MYFNWKRKVGSLILAVSLIGGNIFVPHVFAEENNIEIILTDITEEDQTTLLGEAKIKVSVKGDVANANIIQAAFTFSGELEYNSTEYLLGEDNTSEGKVQQTTDASTANSSGAFTSTIISINEPVALTNEVDAFVISFIGNPGENVNLTVDAQNTYVKSSDTKYYATENISEDAVSSTTAKEAVAANIELVIDKVNGFTANAERPVSLKITNERTKKSVNAIIEEKNRTKISPLTYLITKSLIKGDTYTVELSANGYIPYIIENYDFSKTLTIDNSKFIPGDINEDKKVDKEDKALYEQLIKEDKYSAKADFNCDGKTDDLDNVFLDIESTDKKVPGKVTSLNATGGLNQISLSWAAPENGGAVITGYTVKYGTSRTNLNQTKEITSISTLKDTITSLSSDTTYYLQIAAKNEVGTGEYSDIVSAKTERAFEGNAGGGTGGGTGGGSGGGGGFSGGVAMGGSPSGSGTGNTGTDVTPPSSEETFTDIDNYGWAKEAIYQLKREGIISGISSRQYAPQNNIKRGDFILILSRMLALEDEFSENFFDVPVGSYYYNAIGSARAAGIAKGNGNNFMPENTITRQDLITLAYRAFLEKGYIEETNDMSSLDKFGDKDNISDYAKTAMASMVKAGIIQGSNGNVNPKGFATRAEVAVMCARLMGLVK